MTKEEAYELIQRQNWYKLFIKAMESEGRIFNNAYRLHSITDWIDCAFTWHCTPQGSGYWREIHNKWKTLIR